MAKHIKIKERHCPPQKYDIEPYGTVYKVTNEALSFDYYIQLSQEENAIDWKPLSCLLTELFSNLYDNVEFIEELLFLYHEEARPPKLLIRMLESYLK